MKFKSLDFKYNTKNTFDIQNNVRGTTYYFFGYKDYSEAIIDEYTFTPGTGMIALSTGEPGMFYPNRGIEASIMYKLNPYVFKQYISDNNNIIYSCYMPGSGYFGEEHRFENGKLVYWALTNGEYPYHYINVKSDRIEQEKKNIIKYERRR
jgi:hypothetical protein